ncbi:MAG: hypothetical protein ETSY1_03965 [Candidatus Entotheonella factor]|uniref:PqqD family protein n=1 Tax=Entotheonella factor TaxID=1429438 RepID=W4LW73_ENTF1|nr:MAG: hypothetical protein ETSY1_03965 [Candidatus Entotheonella factor]
MQTSLPRQVIPKTDVLFQPLNGESILLNLYTEQYYSLDDVGTRMWELFKAHGHVDTVIQHLLAVYNVEEGHLRRDLAVLIDHLVAAKLVTTEV